MRINEVINQLMRLGANENTPEALEAVQRAIVALCAEQYGYINKVPNPDRKVAYSFSYTNDQGSTYALSASEKPYYNLGENELTILCRAFNKFLHHIGYPAFDKDLVFPESITEEECDYLICALEDYRSNNE